MPCVAVCKARLQISHHLSFVTPKCLMLAHIPTTGWSLQVVTSFADVMLCKTYSKIPTPD